MNVECHYAIVMIDRQLFAIAARDIREMIMMPEVAWVPDAPEHIRGVCNLRGCAVPIIDTRIRIGRRSARQEIDEFYAQMQEREQDHVSWLEELDVSVRERSEFRLTLDPHQCAFGRWYDTYESVDTLISALLKKFDTPHKRIHGIGVEVQAHLASDHTELAKSLTLRTLIYTQQREMAIVLTGREKIFGAAVDALVSVEPVRSSDIGPIPPGLEHGGLVSSFARRERTGEIILILDPDRLFCSMPFASPEV